MIAALTTLGGWSLTSIVTVATRSVPAARWVRSPSVTVKVSAFSRSSSSATVTSMHRSVFPAGKVSAASGASAV